MTNRSHKLLLTFFALVLSSCSTTNSTSNEQQPNGNVCDTQAVLVNPNTQNSAIDGIGGTGIHVAKSGNGGGEGGIGGTGIVAKSNKPVFGTGGIGGTGIVGVITGFASICINGVEVNYDATTPVWENGKPSTLNQLAVGQVVSVRAVGNGPQMTALGIGVIQAVVGPVNAIDAATGELRVMGQKINASQINLSALKVGEWLRVSGHSLASGEVMPSHVQAIPLQTGRQAQVRGIARNTQAKIVMLGDTRVDLSSLTTATTFANGDELWVSGHWNGQALQAGEVAVNPTAQGLGRVEKVILEGFIQTASGHNLSLGSQTLVLSDRTHIVGGTSRDLVVNRRVQVVGLVSSDQRIAVERVELNRTIRKNSSGKSFNTPEDTGNKLDDTNLVKPNTDDANKTKTSTVDTSSDSSSSHNSGSSNSGSGSSNSGKGSASSNSGSSGSSGSSVSSGSGSSGSGSSGSSGSNSGSPTSGSSGSSNSGSSSSGSSSSGKGSSGSGKSSSK
jgi:hypothetical protein